MKAERRSNCSTRDHSSTSDSAVSSRGLRVRDYLYRQAFENTANAVELVKRVQTPFTDGCSPSSHLISSSCPK